MLTRFNQCYRCPSARARRTTRKGLALPIRLGPGERCRARTGSRKLDAGRGRSSTEAEIAT